MSLARFCAWRSADSSVVLTALSALADEAAPDDFARHAAAVVPHLCGDGDGRVCVAALDALDVLEPPAIAPHAAAILARLEATETSLRYRVVEVLATLEPQALVEIAPGVEGRRWARPPMRACAAVRSS